MQVFVDLDGWSVSGEDKLLAWLEDEARREEVDCEEVQFILVGNEQIRELNEQFLSHEGPTDVITFDYRESDEDDPALDVAEEELAAEDGERDATAVTGDVSSELDEAEGFPEAEIYVSLQIAHVQAADYGCSVSDEVSRLMLHGILHLAGWDDNTAAKRRAMNQREDAGLARAGRETGVLPWQINEPVEQRG